MSFGDSICEDVDYDGGRISVCVGEGLEGQGKRIYFGDTDVTELFEDDYEHEHRGIPMPVGDRELLDSLVHRIRSGDISVDSCITICSDDDESIDDRELIHYASDDGFCRIVVRQTEDDWRDIVEQVYYSNAEGSYWKDVRVLGSAPPPLTGTDRNS